MAPSLETIDGLLADPLIQVLMRADRVETGALKQMLTGVAVKRHERGLDLSGARVWFCGQSRPAAAKLWPWAEKCVDRVNC